MKTLRFTSSLILASCCFLLATVWLMPKVEPELARPITLQKQATKTTDSQEPKWKILKKTKSETTINKVTSFRKPSYTSSKESRKKTTKMTQSRLANTQHVKSAKDHSASPDFRKFQGHEWKKENKNGQNLPLKEEDPLEEAESALISLDKIFN